MANGYLLPRADFTRNALIDLRGLNAGIDNWQARSQLNVENARQNKLMQMREQQMAQANARANAAAGRWQEEMQFKRDQANMDRLARDREFGLRERTADRQDALFRYQKTQYENAQRQFENMTPEQRASEATRFGIEPGTPEYQQLVFNGKLPAIKPPKPPRALNYGEITKMSDDQANMSGALGVGQSFRDDYAGYGILGRAAVGASRVGLPTASGDSADWWARYDRRKNVVRNKLFGAALTPTEAEEFEKTDINPNMKPDLIRKNLKRQAEILVSAVKRKRDLLIASGYDPAVIDRAYPMQEIQSAETWLRSSAAPKASGPSVGAVEDGYRFKGGNPADPNSWERVQ